jgi:alpha-1,2-mannosyltransferase
MQETLGRAPSVEQASAQRRLPAPVWWSLLSVAMLLCGVATFLVWAQSWAWTGMYLTDLRSYIGTGEAVRAGGTLYEPGVSTLPMLGGTFKYTPFAAGVFAGLTLVPGLLVPILAMLTNLFALGAVIWLALGQLGYARDQGRVAATTGLTAVGLALQPVVMEFLVGQVNLALMLIVLADLLGKDRRWRGVGVGLAAGIKLIPGIFVCYLLVTRRYRAAAVAMGAFATTILTGFLALPHDSGVFWSANIADQSRITGSTDATSPENQSIRGAIARLTGLADPGAIWIPVALVVGLAALWIAARAHRAGRELLAVSTVGAAMVLVTPWTWSHYWVWFVPFFVMAVCGVLRSGNRVAGAVVLAAFLLACPWPVGYNASSFPLLGLVLLPEPFPPLAQALAHTLYVVAGFALLALAAARPAWLEPGPASAFPADRIPLPRSSQDRHPRTTVGLPSRRSVPAAERELSGPAMLVD